MLLVVVKQRLTGINAMKIKKFLYMVTVALAMAIALTLGACTEAEVENGGTQQSQEPVLFTVGNIGSAVTRASIGYLQADSRFVCSMFFHAGAKDTDNSPFYSVDNKLASDVNMTTTWLKINDATGNAVYRQSSFNETGITQDDFGFDKAAKIFYWQNRLNHIFLALTDNNKLKTQDGTDDTTAGTLKLFPDVQTVDANGNYMLEYDLTTGSKMTDQPDPILAFTTMKPEGASPEANRVELLFKHQFAQVQVNLKNSQDTTSVVIGNSEIISVELLGVAEKAYVPYCINADGTLPAVVAEDINIDEAKYNDTKKSNPYGSSFSLFVSDNTTSGYLKTFEGIAFGTIQRIRVTWKEPNYDVTHTTILNSVLEQQLESGKKYIYNIELRRSSIAQVTPKIVDWGTDGTYEADGTIVNKDDEK